MKITRGRIIQIITVFVVHLITLFILQKSLSGFQADSFRSLVAATIVLALAQSAFWWVFISFFSWLPSWLYPILTFALNGLLVMGIGNLVRGITIDSVTTGILIALWLAVADAVFGELLSLDEDSRFDRNVTGRMVSRHGKPVQSDEPGFLFLEIDGLSEMILRQAMDKGFTPTMKRWVDKGSHQIIGWETDFSSQTGAMQTGILLGNNTDVPAYRWWDRAQNRIVMSGMPKDAHGNRSAPEQRDWPVLGWRLLTRQYVFG